MGRREYLLVRTSKRHGNGQKSRITGAEFSRSFATANLSTHEVSDPCTKNQKVPDSGSDRSSFELGSSYSDAVRIAIALTLVTSLCLGETVAIQDAKIYTVTNGVIERGTILIEDGRIAAVGPSEDIAVPAGAKRIAAAGRVIIPGLVDTHSHIGVYSRPGVIANSDGNEATGPEQAVVRAMDSLFPRDPGIRQATAGGVTTANVMPGSANVMGGQTAYIKLRGRTVDEMLISLEGRPSGMKMANGENPKRTYGRRGKAPATRMKLHALQREIFLKAKQYQAKRAEGAEGKDTPRDLALDAIVEILERKRTVHFHTHRSDDIVSALRLADEFGFEIVLHHGTESYLVADEIAKRKISVSHTIVDSPGGKPEAINLRYDTPAVMHAAGVKIAINTDDPVTESRLLLRTTALCVRGGLPVDAALAALTIHPAQMMHLDHRVGSIEKGKDADFVMLSGEPFSAYTRVLQTWIDGAVVFDYARPLDRRYAVGGYRIQGQEPAAAYPLTKAPARAKGPLGGASLQNLPRRFAVRAGVLFTGDTMMRDTVVLVRNGTIEAIGPHGTVVVPDNVPMVTAAWVTPGLIDAHASAGLSGALNVPADQDLIEPGHNHAAARALDGFAPQARLVRYLLRHGVTVVQAVPGPRSTIAGQAGIFRTFSKNTSDATIRATSAMVFNLGEGPKGERATAPGTRMGIAALIRKALTEAKQPVGEKSELDVNRSALARVIAGEIPAIFVTHREDDLHTAARIAREFKLRAVLSQATEGYLMTGDLKKWGYPIIAAPTMQRAGDLQRFNTSFENAARIADAGVLVCFSSGYESYVPKTRVILFEASVAAAHGLGWAKTMRALTLDAARVLGIDDRYGSLAVGKSATLVAYDDDPLETASHVLAVFGDGTLVYRK